MLTLGHLPTSGEAFTRAKPAQKGAPLCGELAEPARPEGLLPSPAARNPKRRVPTHGHTPFLCNFYWYCFTFSIRVAFSTASTMTPTSAKTPHHMFVMPSAVRIRHSALTASAKTMF